VARLTPSAGVCVSPLLSLYYPLDDAALLPMARHAFRRAWVATHAALLPIARHAFRRAAARLGPVPAGWGHPVGPAGGAALLVGYAARDWGEGGGGSVAREAPRRDPP
jgi:hypothetical protein